MAWQYSSLSPHLNTPLEGGEIWVRDISRRRNNGAG